MIKFNIVAFTHTGIGLNEIGKFHLDEVHIVPTMKHIKKEMNIYEIMYLSTCNRVEFIFVTDEEVDADFLALFFKAFQPNWNHAVIQNYISKAKTWNGINAVNHLIEVASSVDSMVIGEREIITQVRNAYDFSKENKLAGDLIRVVIRQTIETAKKVYTETSIATKPVSVVSLAYHALVERQVALNARIVVIGTGVTNTNMCRFLKKHGYKNFTIYNRTKKNADVLAKFVSGKSKPLIDLDKHSTGADIIVTCTSANEEIITEKIFKKITGDSQNRARTVSLASETVRKRTTIIDLAIPSDTAEPVKKLKTVDYISVESLKKIADVNLKERRKELIKVRQIIYDAVEEFKEIFKLRQVELKMRSIPEKVKEIRALAVNEVFSKELKDMDENAKQVLEKILDYMEKKYISVPMVMAKEMMTNTNEQ